MECLDPDQDTKERKSKKAKKSKKRKGDEIRCDSFLEALNRSFRKEQLRQQGPLKTRAYRKKLLGKTKQEHRDLDRIAYLLEVLNPRRVCVAVGLREDESGEKYLDAFANVHDERLAKDLRKLAEARRSREKREKLLAKLEATSSGCRLKKTEENAKKRAKVEEKHKKKVKRRFHKGLRAIAKLGIDKDHVRAPNTGVTKPVHAEQQATQWATDKGITFSDLGISKLCCAKCWKALQAAAEANLHPNLATGTHMKTYASKNGWPIPEYLLDNDAALRKFLGKKAYEQFKNCDEQCMDNYRAAIEEESLAVRGQQETDLVSSEEEYEYEGSDSEEMDSDDGSSSVEELEEEEMSGSSEEEDFPMDDFQDGELPDSSEEESDESDAFEDLDDQI